MTYKFVMFGGHKTHRDVSWYGQSSHGNLDKLSIETGLKHASPCSWEIVILHFSSSVISFSAPLHYTDLASCIAIYSCLLWEMSMRLTRSGETIIKNPDRCLLNSAEETKVRFLGFPTKDPSVLWEQTNLTWTGSIPLATHTSGLCRVSASLDHGNGNLISFI